MSLLEWGLKLTRVLQVCRRLSPFCTAGLESLRLLQCRVRGNAQSWDRREAAPGFQVSTGHVPPEGWGGLPRTGQPAAVGLQGPGQSTQSELLLVHRLLLCREYAAQALMHPAQLTERAATTTGLSSRGI